MEQGCSHRFVLDSLVEEAGFLGPRQCNILQLACVYPENLLQADHVVVWQNFQEEVGEALKLIARNVGRVNWE